MVDLTQLLRSQARRYRCSACGENMADCDINVLAQQGNRALVRVTCTACKDENLLQIVFQGEGAEAEPDELKAPRPRLFDEPRPAEVLTEPISADEVLDVHSMLSQLRGGFKELVGQV